MCVFLICLCVLVNFSSFSLILPPTASLPRSRVPENNTNANTQWPPWSYLPSGKPGPCNPRVHLLCLSLALLLLVRVAIDSWVKFRTLQTSTNLFLSLLRQARTGRTDGWESDTDQCNLHSLYYLNPISLLETFLKIRGKSSVGDDLPSMCRTLAQSLGHRQKKKDLREFDFCMFKCAGRHTHIGRNE